MEKKLVNYLFEKKYKNKSPNLCKNKIETFITSLLKILFPQMGQNQFNGPRELELELRNNEQLLKDILSCLNDEFHHHCEKSQRFINSFYNELINIEGSLSQDANFIHSEDPAAKSLEEVIICYPGFYAICIYRVANFFYNQKVDLLPRVLSEFAHQKTGIEIHPGAKIASPFFIDHGTGIVIGETTIIGPRVKIFQGVTLGALSVKRNLKDIKRHPTIEKECVIYANATILGGKTIIGKGSVIGGNAWITKSVKKKSFVSFDGV